MARLHDLKFRWTLALSTTLVLAAGCGGKADITFVGEGADSVCGDGAVGKPVEDCDDSNTGKGDGCSEKCKSEPGYVCTGEPSTCLLTCGNDKLDTGETCEDGNLDDKDGCTASCQIEGTCEAPAALTFKAAADGSLVAKVDSSTSGGGKQFDAAACGGDDAGAGADRIYSFVLENPADLSLKLSGSFNSTLRLLKDQPCDVKKSLLCSNADGNADEVLSSTDLAAGTYYVVVDGAAGSSEGEFTLTVTAACPLSSVKIEQVDGYIRDGAYIRNYADKCSVNLKRLAMGFKYYSSEYPISLPDRLLAAGESVGVFTQDYDNPAAKEIAGEFYMETVSGAALLCKGACDFDSGTNVLDAVSWGVDAPSLPSGLSMDPSAITAIEYSTDAFTDYRRVEFVGANPKFKATDWGLIFQADPERFPSGTPVGVMTNGWNLIGTATMNVVEDPDEGRVFEVTSTANGTNGFYASTPPMTPARISYRFRCSGSGQSARVYLGTPLVPWSVFVQQCSGGSVIFYSNGPLIVLPLDDGSWHTVELRDMDWTARTFDVYFDGDLVVDPNDISITANDFGHENSGGTIDAVESFWVGNGTALASSQFADIQMR